MDSTRGLRHSYIEYLQALEISGVKLEYCGGEIYAMAGETPEHSDLAASVLRLLGNALVGRCRIFSSDLRVRIEATDLTTFPDGTVVYGSGATTVLTDTDVHLNIDELYARILIEHAH